MGTVAGLLLALGLIAAGWLLAAGAASRARAQRRRVSAGGLLILVGSAVLTWCTLL